MSKTLVYSDRTIWNPSSNVWSLFIDSIQAIENTYDKRSGIEEIVEDVFQIQPERFSDFLNWLIRYYSESSNSHLHILLQGVVKMLIRINYSITGEWIKVDKTIGYLIEDAKRIPM